MYLNIPWILFIINRKRDLFWQKIQGLKNKKQTTERNKNLSVLIFILYLYKALLSKDVINVLSILLFNIYSLYSSSDKLSFHSLLPRRVDTTDLIFEKELLALCWDTALLKNSNGTFGVFLDLRIDFWKSKSLSDNFFI